MLSYLRIRGLALLDDVSLDLAAGMNVLTGETGAGKSIIVDALSLLRGARGRAELVREGADSITIDAMFDVDQLGGQPILDILAERGLPTPDDEGLVLRRVVPRAGRGRSFAQAELVTRDVLAGITERLVDICSQHEHHSLTKVSRHLELLDIYAALHDDVAAYGEAYRAYAEAAAALDDLRERAAQGDSRADYLRFQLEELERIDPQPGEHETLKQRLALLRGSHEFAELAHQLEQELYEDDRAVTSRLGSFAERARRGADATPKLAEIAEQLSVAEAACEEAAHLAARLREDLDVDPAELEQVEERVHELELLRRKHGVDLEELAGRTDAMRQELDELQNAGEHLAALDSRTRELLAVALKQAKALHRKRRDGSRGLAKAVEGELAALHMQHARMEVEVKQLGDDELGPRGLDDVRFLFSANPGEPTAPLSKVASGGELSRVLLAVKGVLATGDKVATYVFDEVDAGVGGAVAESIGRRLKLAATDHQVLCITHLPQIAAFADTHFRVEKKRRGGRTVTVVKALDAEERVEELARMLGGAKVTKSAREHAQQLLAEARKSGKRRAPPAKAATRRQ